MTHMKLSGPVMALCAAGLMAGCVSSGTGVTTPVNPDPNPFASLYPRDTYQADPVMDTSFATILNNVRLDNGAGPVTYNAKLDQAAQGHADDMLARNYYSHVSPEGLRVDSRVTATGYEWKRVGENIAQGPTSEEWVLNGWENSPAHHAAQVNPEYEEFGLGRAGTGPSTRWVLVLADPK